MALLVTGAVLLLIMLLASLGSQFLGITLVYDVLAWVSNVLGIRPEVLQRIIPLIGTILLVIGYVQINRSKDNKEN
jgi:hypothetical protein